MTARAAIAASLFALAGCEKTRPLENKLTSFKVRITDPAEAVLGTPTQLMDPQVRDFTLSIEAVGADGKPFTDFNGDVDLRLFFLSGVNPPRKTACRAPPAGNNPLQLGTDCYRVRVAAGAASGVKVKIAPNFGYGPSAFWVEPADKSVLALGASQTLWRPPVTVRAIQETNNPALGPLNNRQVILERSASPEGALVVTGVFAQAYSIYDTGEASPWKSLLIYTFSQPARSVRIGTTVKNISGTMQEFNGLTEVNFPQYEMDDEEVDPGRVPVPSVVEAADLTDANALGKMEPRESAPVRAEKWRVCWMNPHGQSCPTAARVGNDSDFSSWCRFAQWKIAPVLEADGSCPDRNKSMSVISGTTLPAFKPVVDAEGTDQPYKGKVVCRLDGILSHVVPNDDSCATDASRCINLWMTNPRGPDDLGAIKDTPEECP